MVRFTAIQTDGFKSNDLPSTKIVIWPNKIPSSAAASLVIQSVFSFAPLLMQTSRFLDLDTVLPSFPAQSEESHQTALCLEVAGRAEQHRSPPTTELPQDPCKEPHTVGFPFRSVQTVHIHPPSKTPCKVQIPNAIRYNDVFLISS